MKKLFILSIVILGIKPLFGQFNEEKIRTDSSEINIVRNSAYKIWKETYKNKDLIFYSVRNIDDTTQIIEEGWERKNHDRVGNWITNSPNGIWLNTINYDNDTWKYNRDEYPYHAVLDSIKQKADKIIIEKYGQAFFKNNVRFKFHGAALIGEWKTLDSITIWDRNEYVGDWTEPIKKKPNGFYLDYTIKLDNKHYYYDMLRVELDSAGNLIDNSNLFEVLFKERKVPKSDKFHLKYDDALEVCKKNGLVIKKGQEFEATLRYGFRKRYLYAGEYYFQVAQQYDKKTSGDCSKECVETKYYKVWRFNPWTSELFFNKKMKIETYLTPKCAVSGNYIEIEK